MLQWEKAVHLVYDVLGVMVDHQQVINSTEDVGIVPYSFPICLLLEKMVRVNRA